MKSARKIAPEGENLSQSESDEAQRAIPDLTDVKKFCQRYPDGKGMDWYRSHEKRRWEAFIAAEEDARLNCNSRLHSVTEDDLPMTMQIGMVGKDGIVLASDKLWSTARYGKQGLIRDEQRKPKIFVNGDRSVAISCAQDMILAETIAVEIISRCGEWYGSGDCRLLAKIVNPFGGKEDFECIVAEAKYRRLTHIFCEKGGYPLVKSVGDRICAGDAANPAKYWHLRYYRDGLSHNQLKQLGVQLVVDAAHFNSATIGGLEMVYSDSTGFHAVPDEEIEELEKHSRERSKSIGDMLLKFTGLPSPSA